MARMVLLALMSRSLSSSLFALFDFGAPSLKPNSRKKGTLVIQRLLRNQDVDTEIEGGAKTAVPGFDAGASTDYSH